MGNDTSNLIPTNDVVVDDNNDGHSNNVKTKEFTNSSVTTATTTTTNNNNNDTAGRNNNEQDLIEQIDSIFGFTVNNKQRSSSSSSILKNEKNNDASIINKKSNGVAMSNDENERIVVSPIPNPNKSSTSTSTSSSEASQTSTSPSSNNDEPMEETTKVEKQNDKELHNDNPKKESNKNNHISITHPIQPLSDQQLSMSTADVTTCAINGADRIVDNAGNTGCDTNNNVDNTTAPTNNNIGNNNNNNNNNTHVTTVPTPFWKVGLQSKESPLSVNSWITAALTLDGRDKITKIIQYSCRFLGWWLAGHYSKRFLALSKSLSTSRKAFRMGTSLFEMDKLRKMGLGTLILWHLRQQLKESSITESECCMKTSSGNNCTLNKKASQDITNNQNQSTVATKVYNRVVQSIFSQFSMIESSVKPTMTTWMLVLTAIKFLSLLVFWAADNVSFLASSGALDNYRLSDKERTRQRKIQETRASKIANQTYFVACLAGLYINLRSFLKLHNEESQALQRLQREEDKEEESLDKENQRILKEKKFSLLLSLIKSCCDVIVFSNTTGVDLHQRFRGKKNNEGVHCLLGIVSAGTVVYNNFPNVKRN